MKHPSAVNWRSTPYASGWQLLNKTRMKLHPIFSKDFYLWWLIMAGCTILIYSIFGLPEMQGYEKYGLMFWTIGTLFSSLIFGSITYLIYRLFAGKWDNKSYIKIISILFIFTIILLLFK
jgi:hypothetical protein